MRFIYYPFLFILFIALHACNKDLKLPDIEVKKKLVLYGELTAGDSIHIRCGESIPVTAKSPLVLNIAGGTSVSCKDQFGSTHILNGAIDDLTPYLLTIPFSNADIVTAGGIYNFTVVHDELGTATVNVKVPEPFNAPRPDTFAAIYAGDTVIKFNIHIDDQPGEHYYVIEAIKQPMDISMQFFFDNTWYNYYDSKLLYDSLKRSGLILQKIFDTTYLNSNERVYLYTNDKNTENMKENNPLTTFKRILLSDYSFNGQSYTTSVYLQRRPTLDSSSIKGRTFISVKSVSKDYFIYLKGYQSNDNGGGFNSTTVSANVKGNVSNGFGVIGGVYKHEFMYILDRWYF